MSSTQDPYQDAIGACAAGRLAAAARLCELAVEQSRRRAAPGELCAALLLRAHTHIELGNLPAGKACLVEALAIAADDDALVPSRIDAHQGLGAWERLRGSYADAERHYQLAASLAHAADLHAREARALDGLGGLRRRQGRYAEAETFHLQALDLCRLAGHEHSLVAEVCNGLAIVYKYTGRYDEAEPLYRRALAICRRVLGPRHPRTSGIYHNLAGLAFARGDLSKAESYGRRGLDLRAAALGTDHLDVAADKAALAAILVSASRRYDEAEQLLRDALSVFESILGPEHQEIGAALHTLAALYGRTGRTRRAEATYARSLAVKEAALGRHHPHLVSTLNNLALLFQRTGRHNDAKAAYERCLRILGPTSQDPLRRACDHNYRRLLGADADPEGSADPVTVGPPRRRPGRN